MIPRLYLTLRSQALRRAHIFIRHVGDEFRADLVKRGCVVTLGLVGLTGLRRDGLAVLVLVRLLEGGGRVVCGGSAVVKEDMGAGGQLGRLEGVCLTRVDDTDRVVTLVNGLHD
jgi:hypothetical protein